MLWRGNRESDNVEDSRGGGGGLAVGGGLGALVIGLIAMLLGKNPTEVMNSINGGNSAPTYQQAPAGSNGQEDDGKAFVRTVLAATEDVWDEQFKAMGKTYVNPTLKLFTRAVQSGCGTASSETGPFYCPLDSKVYLDLSFFKELKDRFSAGGDFANAYVIAHEVGHHVQNLLGVSDKVHDLQQRASQRDANKLSVCLELQADFYAGVWANHTQQMRKMIESGDIESALNAAAAIGDDRLQQESQGRVAPETFTHGTSAQRVAWFRKGYETGDIKQGDTFNGAL